MNEYIKDDYYNRAERAFSVAVDMFNLGHYVDAMSKIYYSIFYATEAVLITEGITPKSHRGVLCLFIENYIKTGKFKQSHSKLLSNAFQERIASDYEIKFSISKEEVNEYMHKAREFLDEVKDFLDL